MHIDISIIIVNYNVQYFIEQCLNSIFRISDFQGTIEVIVVDNDSQDGSVKMIEKQFSKVQLIKNQSNVGFSVANNQGLKVAQGTYVLLLNPDTILEEKTLSLCFSKMESESQIGALGVKMVDGAGNFLPESKRGFPYPLVSFYKFSGLYKLFPKSRKFNAYYLGHIDENEIAEVDILCGAFMFMRKSHLDQIGYLDEAFFMYGEDIDLSYRFLKSGQKVFYYPETTIIHFKGESTQKNSIQYSKRFYNAMDIFAQKHFRDSKAKVFLRYLALVIKLKALINHCRNFIDRFFFVILDIVLIFSGLMLISKLWAVSYFNNLSYYEDAPLMWNFSWYTIIWIISLLFAGAYDANYRWMKVIRNILIGTGIILAIYGLLGEQFRSSRAIILFANFYVLLAVFVSRFLASWLRDGKPMAQFSKGKNVLLISEEKEAEKITEVMGRSEGAFKSITLLPTAVSTFELLELIRLKNIDEIICNTKDLGMSRVIKLMSELGDRVAFKITGDESLGIIGSSSKNSSGEIYTIAVQYAIQNPSNRRVKRTFDLIVGAILLLLIPILLLFKRAKMIIPALPSVIVGKKTLVGYISGDKNHAELPLLKASVIPLAFKSSEQERLHTVNLEYAKNYSIWEDVRRLALIFEK